MQDYCDTNGVPYMKEGEMANVENECSISAELPWGGKYPPGVGIVKREGLYLVTPDGRRLADGHQRILSFSMGLHAKEIQDAIDAAAKRFPGVTMCDTTEYFEPATLFMSDLHKALLPYGDYLFQLATTGTGANEQAIRLAMGSLGGPQNVQLLALDDNYGGASLFMNSICKAAGWTGDTSLVSQAKVLKLDGSNMDEIFAQCLKAGKIPILIMEDGVLGVGGFTVLDIAFMRALTERVSDAGGRKIFDEVQAFVRATQGKGLFGFNRWADPKNPKHLPDFITFAKGMGDGHAIAGLGGRREVIQQVKTPSRKPGNTFDTFSRVRDAITSARKVLEIVQGNSLDRNMHLTGGDFQRNLRSMVARYGGLLKGVVGMGGMTGIEFKDVDKLTKAMIQAPESGMVVAKGGSPDHPVMRLPLQFDTDGAFVEKMSECVENMLKNVQRETAA